MRKLGFEARGCAISIASADLMAEVVAGHDDAEVRVLADRFRDMARTGTSGPADDSAIERLEPLAGVHEFPSRVKCATLAWHALLAALDGQAGESGRSASSE